MELEFLTEIVRRLDEAAQPSAIIAVGDDEALLLLQAFATSESEDSTISRRRSQGAEVEAW